MFSTFRQSHWQASRPQKSLLKGCCFFEYWRTKLSTYCLIAPHQRCWMCLIILLSQENIICLASFTFSVLQVFDYNLTTKNSSSLNSLSLISVIHFHWLRVKKKLFLPFPDSDDFVSQPLNAWKNRNEKQKFIWPQGSSYLVNRYESQRFSCTKFNPKFI